MHVQTTWKKQSQTKVMLLDSGRKFCFNPTKCEASRCWLVRFLVVNLEM